MELNACTGGCVGGVFCIENAYVAKARLQSLRRYLPVAKNHLPAHIPSCMKWTDDLEFAPVLKLSDNLEEAMDMMNRIDSMCEEFRVWIAAHAERPLATLLQKMWYAVWQIKAIVSLL